MLSVKSSSRTQPLGSGLLKVRAISHSGPYSRAEVIHQPICLFASAIHSSPLHTAVVRLENNRTAHLLPKQLPLPLPAYCSLSVSSKAIGSGRSKQAPFPPTALHGTAVQSECSSSSEAFQSIRITVERKLLLGLHTNSISWKREMCSGQTLAKQEPTHPQSWIVLIFSLMQVCCHFLLSSGRTSFKKRAHPRPSASESRLSSRSSVSRMPQPPVSR